MQKLVSKQKKSKQVSKQTNKQQSSKHINYTQSSKQVSNLLFQSKHKLLSLDMNNIQSKNENKWFIMPVMFANQLDFCVKRTLKTSYQMKQEVLSRCCSSSIIIYSYQILPISTARGIQLIHDCKLNAISKYGIL